MRAARPGADVDDPRGLRRRLPARRWSSARTGSLRLERVSFAAHFDSLMRGRRGAVRPRTEAELHPFRERSSQMFRRPARGDRAALLPGAQHDGHPGQPGPGRRDGARRRCRWAARCCSFQPAAHVGDDRRWKEAYAGGRRRRRLGAAGGGAGPPGAAARAAVRRPALQPARLRLPGRRPVDALRRPRRGRRPRRPRRASSPAAAGWPSAAPRRSLLLVKLLRVLAPTPG